MTLEIRPVTEDDIDTFTLTAIEAFQSGIGHLLTGHSTVEIVEKKDKATLTSLKEDPTTKLLQVVDTETGEMVAGAMWNFYEKGHTEEELDEMFARPTPEQGYRTELKGYTSTLHLITSSAWSWSHAGQLGVDHAGELGIEAYHESSVEARKLYERFGYKAVKAVEFDTADYGRPELGVDVSALMYREAWRVLRN